MKPRSTPERFWARVAIGAPDACWLWIGTTLRGYGKLMYQGRYWISHRLAYSLAKGHIPYGMLVIHSCDNPGCCNPDHLRLGTDADNVRDCIERNRRRVVPYGEEHPMAKLTPAIVLRIRSSREKGSTLAHCFNVSGATISEIRSGKKWRHGPFPLEAKS